MSEYILNLAQEFVENYPDALREEIVRCMDCKYARKTDAGMDCDRHILCARFNQNGFCAWGKRKEVEQ